MKKLGFLVLALAAVALAAPEAWAQRQRGGGFGGGFNGLFLLGQKSVQQELKLSDDQVKQASEQLDKERASAGGLRDLSREERQEKMAERTKANQAAVDAILQDDQKKRFKQISLQQRGPQAFADPQVAEALDLTADQKSKLAEIQQSGNSARRELFQAGAGGGDREAMRKKMDALRASSNEKAMDVLSSDQKEKWKALSGEPFKGEITPPPFRGNRPAGAARPVRRAAAAIPGRGAFQWASFTGRHDAV